MPQHDGGRAGIDSELESLAGVVVREEHDTVRVKAFEEHYAHRRGTIGVRRRERHSIGFDDSDGDHIGEPLPEESDRVIAGGTLIEADRGVFGAHALQGWVHEDKIDPTVQNDPYD